MADVTKNSGCILLFGKISGLLLPVTQCSGKVRLYVDETVTKQILECNEQKNIQFHERKKYDK